MLKIIVDLDGTIADIITHWLQKYNEDYDDNLQEEDIKDYGTHNFTKFECGTKIYDYIGKEGFFLNARPELDGCELINKLHDKGHLIYFATKTPLNSKTGHWEKCQWVDLHLPRIGKERVISIRNKGLLAGDVLIEDYYKNFEGFPGLRILIDRPWNRHIDNNGFVRCKTWKDVEKVINIHSVF